MCLIASHCCKGISDRQEGFDPVYHGRESTVSRKALSVAKGMGLGRGEGGLPHSLFTPWWTMEARTQGKTEMVSAFQVHPQQATSVH